MNVLEKEISIFTMTSIEFMMGKSQMISKKTVLKVKKNNPILCVTINQVEEGNFFYSCKEVSIYITEVYHEGRNFYVLYTYIIRLRLQSFCVDKSRKKICKVMYTIPG